MENLFSYGTLKQESVQLKNFGRLLEGHGDVLQGYCLREIEIQNKSVIKISGKKLHPIIVFTGKHEDEVRGEVFRVTLDELLKADGYEVEDYERVEVLLRSGIRSWVYASRRESLSHAG